MNHDGEFRTIPIGQRLGSRGENRVFELQFKNPGRPLPFYLDGEKNQEHERFTIIFQ
jgi:hypothetical protein